MNGVFWIETGTGEEVLAVCYPIWNCDFSETVLKQSEQTEEDVREGIDSTLGISVLFQVGQQPRLV